MYGTRDAASNWEDCYMEFASDIGFASGEASPCVFKHRSRRLWLTVHGDDFTFCGVEEELMWIKGKSESWFEIKVKGILDVGPEDDKEIVILGRIVKWGEDGIRYQADPKHVQAALREMGMPDATPM